MKAETERVKWRARALQAARCRVTFESMFGTGATVNLGGRVLRPGRAFSPTPRRFLFALLLVALSGPSASAEALLDMTQYQRLKAAWSEARHALDNHAWEEAVGQTRYLVGVRTDLGLPNAYELSAALLQAAQEALGEDNAAAAVKLAAASGSLSPDMAAARFEEASLLFSAAPFGVSDQLKAMRGALETLPDDLGATFALMGNTASALLHILILLLLAFALAMVVRYRAPWAHDVTRMLPAGVTRLHGTVLLFTILVAPFLLGLGLLSAVILWLLGAALYQQALERVVTIVLLAALAAVPYLTSYSVRAVRYAGTPQAALERCSRSMCSAADRRRLEEAARTSTVRFAAHYTLALQDKRSQAADGGSFSKVNKRLQAALKVQNRAESQILLGTIQYLEALTGCDSVLREEPGAQDTFDARLSKAIDRFREAATLDDTSVAAHYNAMVLLRQLSLDAQADHHASKAAALDGAEVARFSADVARNNNLARCQMANLGNRHLMEPRWSAAELRDAVMAEDAPADSLLLPFAEALTGRMGPQLVGATAAGAAVLVFLLLLAGRLVRVSRHCAVCFGVADPGTRVDAHRGASVCSACVQADVHRGISDAKETWTRDQTIQQGAIKRSRNQRLVTWFLPGFGQLLRGAPVRGVVFMTLVFASLFVGLGLHQLILDPRQPAAVGSGRMFFFGTVAFIAYLIALFDAHATRARPAFAKKRNGPGGIS